MTLEGCRKVGYIRICFALIQIVDRLLLGLDLEFFLSPTSGVLPIEEERHGFLGLMSLLRLIVDDKNSFNLWVLYWVGLANCALLLLGIAPRLNAFMLYVNTCSFHNANWMLCDGVKTGVCPLLRIFSLFFLFLPLHHITIWDEFGTAKSVFTNGKSMKSNWPMWPVWLFQVQSVLVMLGAMVGKFEGTTWINGSAMYYVSSCTDEGVGIFNPLILFNRHLPSKMMTWAALVVEVLAPITIWFGRLRKPTLFLLVATFIGMDLTMNMGTFEYYNIMGWSFFLIRSQSQEETEEGEAKKSPLGSSSLKKKESNKSTSSSEAERTVHGANKNRIETSSSKTDPKDNKKTKNNSGKNGIVDNQNSPKEEIDHSKKVDGDDLETTLNKSIMSDGGPAIRSNNSFIMTKIFGNACFLFLFISIVLMAIPIDTLIDALDESSVTSFEKKIQQIFKSNSSSSPSPPAQEIMKQQILEPINDLRSEIIDLIEPIVDGYLDIAQSESNFFNGMYMGGTIKLWIEVELSDGSHLAWGSINWSKLPKWKRKRYYNFLNYLKHVSDDEEGCAHLLSVIAQHILIPHGVRVTSICLWKYREYPPPFPTVSRDNRTEQKLGWFEELKREGDELKVNDLIEVSYLEYSPEDFEEFHKLASKTKYRSKFLKSSNRWWYDLFEEGSIYDPRWNPKIENEEDIKDEDDDDYEIEDDYDYENDNSNLSEEL